MEKPFIPAVCAGQESGEPVLCFAFRDRELLVYPAVSDRVEVPLVPSVEDLELRIVRRQFLGYYDGRSCWSLELPANVPVPGGMAFYGLRELFHRLGEDLFQIAGKAYQVINWDRDHQFCGRCGSRMIASNRERSKSCSSCGLVNYPRISPAVIMRITRGQEILLARGPNFQPGRFSVLAGFVEPGETLEEAVARETREETGIEIKNIRYFGSQPWPFPNSLMLGFTAEYASGEIVIDGEEIVEAGWFTRDTVPGMPGSYSISRKLISDFLDGETSP